tara:strand:- start:1657 stop:1827 length:171 start_codon:yes stop_codon:yes gene_type:complete
MQKSESKKVLEYFLALEAVAVEYAEKYGVSEAFSKALNDRPSNEAFRLLDDCIDKQ